MKNIIITITAIMLLTTTKINAQEQPLKVLSKYGTCRILYKIVDDKDTLYHFEYINKQFKYGIDTSWFMYSGKLNNLYNLFKTQLDAKPNKTINKVIYEDEVGNIELVIKTLELNGQKYIKVIHKRLADQAYFELTPTILNNLFHKDTHK